MYGRVWMEDADGTHYLDFRKHSRFPIYDDEKKGIRLYLVETVSFKRIPLALTLFDSNESCVNHDGTNRQFLLWSCSEPSSNSWPTDRCLRFWLIKENSAKITSDCIPSGPWGGQSRRSNKVLSTSAGIFFIAVLGDDVNSDTEAGAAGLYEFRDGQVRRLLPGFIERSALSPDGCKLAIFHSWAAEDLRPNNSIIPSFKVVDLCNQTKGK